MRKLCVIFGLTPAVASVWLDYGLSVLYHTVKDPSFSLCRVHWPTTPEMKASADLLQRNRAVGNALPGVFALIEGGTLSCAEYVDPNIQNAYYDGYTCRVDITNLLVYNFFGEVIHAAVNFAGSWHDMHLAWSSNLYSTLLSDEITPVEFALLADTAFVDDIEITKGKILRPRKTDEKAPELKSATLYAVDLVLQRIIPSERQAAEWGVRCLKGPFGRLRTVLPADSYRRKLILVSCIHLLNLRTRTIGLNHIRSTYDPLNCAQPVLN
ncbi:DDE superfamily endonuclease [Gracilaria domingensis]|nr:DDE superfamily endonuclease [Gracilaria domingensis]